MDDTGEIVWIDGKPYLRINGRLYSHKQVWGRPFKKMSVNFLALKKKLDKQYEQN